jgi:hypothetical protein
MSSSSVSDGSPDKRRIIFEPISRMTSTERVCYYILRNALPLTLTIGTAYASCPEIVACTEVTSPVVFTENFSCRWTPRGISLAHYCGGGLPIRWRTPQTTVRAQCLIPSYVQLSFQVPRGAHRRQGKVTRISSSAQPRHSTIKYAVATYTLCTF